MPAPPTSPLLLAAVLLQATASGRCGGPDPRLMPLGLAWAANSVNTVPFRSDPITTHGQRQYAAYYDGEGRVVLAARTIGSDQWQVKVTALRGTVTDAHRSISLAADGEGYLHLAWDHHGHPLRYVRSREPGSWDLTEPLPMTGQHEDHVTYPEFHQLPDGDLLFLFRDGASGRGNLVVNHYDTASRRWSQRHANLVSGEDRRNAYWQACLDASGRVHLSWVWRETADVATNHDLAYARSDDGGLTWTRSDGTAYALPITEATAEVALAIPQRHELINQTSMSADEDGRPIIATYFRPPGQAVVQYAVVHHDGSAWRTAPVTRRRTAFSLGGVGSKAIPISRPQVVARRVAGATRVAVVYRDVERGSRVSASYCADLRRPRWVTRDLTDFPVRFWEPAYDRMRWRRDGVLALYVQLAGQGDAEGLESVPPQRAYVLEWTP